MSDKWILAILILIIKLTFLFNKSTVGFLMKSFSLIGEPVAVHGNISTFNKPASLDLKSIILESPLDEML